MIEIKHRETGVVLHTVRADTLIGVILRGASLSGADLHVASLRGVNLSDAIIIPGWRMIKEA